MLLGSCDLFPKLAEDDFDTLEDGEFYAHNMRNNSFYKVKAKMLYQGERCEIWAERGSDVTEADAQSIANEYDAVIRPLIVDAFSETDIHIKLPDDTEYEFDDILGFADWKADGDGRLTILLLDIKDNYKEGFNDSYVAGYFYAGNFLSKGKTGSYYSNGRDMIYVDIYPGLEKERRQALATFAHELQHLANYATSELRWERKKGYTDTWIDEGLSAHAEYLYLGENMQDKCKWLNDDRNTIDKGNNFFVWGNYKGNPYASLDDYATVYLFFRWLYLQADAEYQAEIFRDVVYSPESDYHAITAVAKKINPAWASWESLLQAWFAANYNPKDAAYGYKGDPYLQETIKVNPIGGNSTPLFPGEGVYSIISGQSPSGNDGNIRYVNLNDMLLTFNANANNSGARENGSLTGVAPALSRTATEDAHTKRRTGPYVIDARDIIGRDEEKNLTEARRARGTRRF